MVKVQNKLSKAADCLEYFTTKQWEFDDENVRKLSTTLNEYDKKEFCFDVAKIDWEVYLEDYILGIRRFVMIFLLLILNLLMVKSRFIFKEETSSIPKARRQISKLYILNRLLQVVGVMVMWHFIALRYAPLRRLWSNSLKMLLHLASMLPFM